MRQIIPQTAARQKWERKVIDLIIECLQVPNGDAQAIIEVNDEIDRYYEQRLTPEQAAAKYCKDFEPDQSERVPETLVFGRNIITFI